MTQDLTMLFTAAGASREELRGQLEALRARVSLAAGDGELAAAAAEARSATPTAPVRAAFAASGRRQALAALDVLDDWLALERVPVVRASRGVALASGAAAPRVGLLLPGQGGPAPRQLGALADCFPEVAAAHARAEIPCGDDGTVPPAAIQLAIVAASLAAVAVVRRLGVTPAFALGHSLGELTALSWAGAFDDATALRLARERGAAMVTRSGPPGAMASVDAEPRLLAALLAGSSLSIACFNAPARHVVSGAPEAVDAFVARARARGATATRLAVTGAFHSPLMREAATAFRATLDALPLEPPRGQVVSGTLDALPMEPLRGHVVRATRDALPIEPLRGRVISSVTGTWLPADADLREHLTRQMLAPVRFLAAARVAARHADLLIEAGPGNALGALMGEISETPVISLRVGERSPRRLLELLATTWACGFTPSRTLISLARGAAAATAAAQPNASSIRRFSAARTSS